MIALLQGLQNIYTLLHIPHILLFSAKSTNNPENIKTDLSVLFCQFITLWKKEDHSANMVKLLAILFCKCWLEVYILQNNITPGRLCFGKYRIVFSHVVEVA